MKNMKEIKSIFTFQSFVQVFKFQSYFQSYFEQKLVTVTHIKIFTKIEIFLRQVRR